MKQITRTEKRTLWDHTVRAPFRRVMAWDMLFFVLGIGVGAGIGAFLVGA